MELPQEDEGRVQAFPGKLTLPTYRLMGENRNPVFHSQYGVAHIYPYTLLDEIASEPVDQTYRTLNLENEFLRVTVLPELGGRVFSVFSKIDQCEVFYKNPIIKFSPLAIRGAFFSGGVEFSFPVAHAPTTADPVNWDMLEYPDGRAAIHIGGLEHMSGMRWTITLTLYPGCCALAQDVRLFNPTPIPGRYHYWTNASLASTDRTEFIYPFHRVRSYEFPGTSSWPVARLDLITSEPGLPGMEGVPMWPVERLHQPMNFRWEKDMLAQVSIFGRDVSWDFFGAWQHDTNCGYAHYADHNDVSGMKLWSWGRAEVGIVNQTALTDDGSIYAETQCGAMETQLDFDFLPPGETRTWREWWLALRDIGGLTCASAQIGALLKVRPGSRADQVELVVGICPVLNLDAAELEISVPGDLLLREQISASPAHPWTHSFSLAANRLAHHPLSLQVRDRRGEVLLDYTQSREVNLVGPSERIEESLPGSAEEFYRLGLDHENFDNRDAALESYRRALDLSSTFAPARLQLGLMLFRAADFDNARTHFAAALDNGEPAAAYYLGLIAWYQGEPDRAEGHFRQLADSALFGPIVHYRLGCIAMHRRQWGEATTLFRKAGENAQYSTLAGLLAGISLRQAGQIEEARRILEQVLERDPLNLVALRELIPSDNTAGSYTGKLARLLSDDPQYHLDLAAFYLDCGLPDEAIEILRAAVRGWDHPMAHYLQGYIHLSEGRRPEADQWLARAREGGPDFVFPSRLWEAIALERHLALEPGDAKANYYLGNFYYAHQRYDEAVSLWKAAAEGLGQYDVLYRNLGLHAWQKAGDLALAAGYFEQALVLNPENQDLYILLDILYQAQGLAEKRQELLAAMDRLRATREDLRKRKLLILVDLGRHEEALEIMSMEDFVPLEMDQSFHRVYVRALSQRAETHLAAGRVEEAIRAYEAALEYPENLGVGRPTTPESAEVLYRLGCACESLGRFSQAIQSWQSAAQEQHPFGHQLFEYIQMSLDKLSRYSELGFEV